MLSDLSVRTIAAEGRATLTDADTRSAAAPHAWVQPGPAFALMRFTTLVENKAWEHLGLTGTEFRLLWGNGAFRGWADPSVRAMDQLMRTGRWEQPPIR